MHVSLTGIHTSAGPLAVGDRVGRGGEGEVFEIADGTRRALKIYTKPDAAREAKVRAIIAARLAQSCPNVAFPRELAFGVDGSFVGFIMPLVTGCPPIHELYAPSSRRDLFPTAEWRFLVRTAANLALAIQKVHAAGAVVGDVNGSGILVSSRAVVTLIDADSFQWGYKHLCRVGVPEYTPPELQGLRLDGLQRTPDHDAFGLAVLVFQLLFLGRHPYAGVPTGRPIGLAEAIKRGQFAFTQLGKVRLTPPPRAIVLPDLPLAMRILFERAFLTGIGPRPTAEEWKRALDDLERGLSTCALNDRHAKPKRLGECPWCRIERETGALVFGRGLRAAAIGEPVQKSPVRSIVEGTLRRAQSVSGEAIEPRDRKVKVAPTGDAVKFKRQLNRLPLQVARIQAALSTGAKPEDRFSRRFLRARDDVANALNKWRDRSGAWDASRAATHLAADLKMLAQLEDQRPNTLANLELRTRQALARADVAQMLIKTATIRGLGPRGRAALAAAGVTSAADITRSSLDQIVGVGERAKIALMLWRDENTAKAMIRLEAEVAPPTIKLEAERRYSTIIAEAERRVRRGACELERLLDKVILIAQTQDPFVNAARAGLAQASADLTYLSIQISIRTSSAPVVKPASSKSKKAAKKSMATSCPKCGGPMIRKWAQGGSSPNAFFLGCMSYPRCSGSRALPKRKP